MMSDEVLLAFRRYVAAHTEMTHTPGTVVLTLLDEIVRLRETYENPVRPVVGEG